MENYSDYNFLRLKSKRLECLFHFQEPSSCKINLFPDSAVSNHSLAW